ncbi:hypothetical protein ACNS7O_00300 [Haloferacaceae archaeon DSL9]
MATVRLATAGDVPPASIRDGPRVDPNEHPSHADGEVTGILFDIAGATASIPAMRPSFRCPRRSVRTSSLPIGETDAVDRHEAADFAERIRPDLAAPVQYGALPAIEIDVDAFASNLRERDLDGECGICPILSEDFRPSWTVRAATRGFHQLSN